MSPLPFATFVNLVQKRLFPDYPDVADRETGLFDEIGLDSFDAYRLLILIEVLADLDVPADEVPHMVTVGDAYDTYTSYVESAGLSS